MAEEKLENKKEKRKISKTIVIINITAIVIIALIVTYFLFIKKDGPKEGLRGDVGRNMNIENI